MIPAQQVPTNWTAIGVIVAICAIIIGIISWFVVHSLAKRRDEQARRFLFQQAGSDLDIVIARWIDVIIDKQERLPSGWGMRLGGPFDMRAGALADVRAESIGEIETLIRKVRPFLNDDAKDRFDDEWRQYQHFEIVGIEMKDSQTGQEFTSHTECKAGLTAILQRMRKIAKE